MSIQTADSSFFSSSSPSKEEKTQERIYNFWRERQIHPSRYMAYAILTLVGVIFCVVSAILILYTHQLWGWSTKLAPYYAFFGAIGAIGVTLSFSSIKWIIYLYKRSKEIKNVGTK